MSIPSSSEITIFSDLFQNSPYVFGMSDSLHLNPVDYKRKINQILFHFAGMRLVINYKIHHSKI